MGITKKVISAAPIVALVILAAGVGLQGVPEAYASGARIDMVGLLKAVAPQQDAKNIGLSLNVTIDPVGAGTVDLAPPGGIYDADTTVTLTPNANAGFRFFAWGGDLSGTDNPGSILVTGGDKNVTAYFTNDIPTLTAVRTVEGETTANAWLFGGVVAEAVGTGFDWGITLRVDGSTHVVDPIPGTLTPTSFRFVIPPLDAVQPGDDVYGPVYTTLQTVGSVGRRVTVTNDLTRKLPTSSAYLDNAIQYYLWQRDDSVATTAFLVDATLGSPTVVPLQLLAGQVFGDAELTIPALALDKPPTPVYSAYGLARAAKLVDASSPLFAHQINAGVGSTAVDDAYDFSVHLYSPTENGNSALGEVAHNEVTTDWTYDRTGETSATLRFPAAGLTVADIRAGVSMWSSLTTLEDYSTITPTEGWLTGTPSLFQSSILATDVVPAITAESEDAAVVNEIVARIYDFSVFSLRQNSDLSEVLAPAGDTSGLTLLDNDGHLISGLYYGSGDVAGGTLLRLRSANGGLGWGVSVVLGDYTGTPGKAITNASGLALATIQNVESEYEILVSVPAYSKAGRVDVAVYPRPFASVTGLTGANPAEQPVTLFANAFQYTGGANPTGLLALIGLLAALIGLGAGGNSGGGDGSPCFIATAAYGTPMAVDIDVLRALRDTYLLNNAAGTAFVDMYYRVSPWIADMVAASPFIAAVVRLALVPVIVLAKLVLATPVLSMAVGALMTLLAFKRKAVKKS